MRLIEVFELDYDIVPKTVGYNLKNNFATLEDQNEALRKPKWAYQFARFVPGADIRKCEEMACKVFYWAYCFAADVPGANIKKCEDAACKDPEYAYLFARYIPGADKERCMKAAGR